MLRVCVYICDYMFDMQYVIRDVCPSVYVCVYMYECTCVCAWVFGGFANINICIAYM